MASKQQKDRAKDLYLRRTYGITLDRYNVMLCEQNYSCAICDKHESMFTKKLAVDHNHKTGKVRGLLCYRCNKFVVGRHSFESSERLFNYMKKYDIPISA